ncbi:putative cytokinetic ring protein SteA [Nakamurella deserti]|uniref:putative cytokinetic ring protein SteA n=1 Tax=Nakamurella deserti TaxID=2164074 RepID=UPI000DBE39FF|nr:putative cytokinetic ring protein SteA [Nakamurella deserti]
MKLLSRGSRQLPGITGSARVSRQTAEVLSRAGNGDIVVVDHPDLDRKTADLLVQAGVAAVVNASASISGRYPNLGPEVLVNSGVVLVDAIGDKVFGRLKDGAKVRLDEGSLFVGDDLIGTGTVQNQESVSDLMIDAKAGMSAQLEAFAANAIEYMKRERSLLLDGVGIPEISTDMENRQVVLVAASADTAQELKKLRKYIADYRPVLVGVDAGADALRAAGHKPDLIIGNPDAISTESLTSKAEVVVPAHTDGHAPGIERIQDLGLGAVTFPASGTSEDLALLLADAHDASLIVTVGMRTTLTDLLDRGQGNTASSFLVRMRVANKVVEAAALTKLYRARVTWWAVMLLIIAATVAIVVALLVSDVSGTYGDLIRQWWNDVTAWVRNLF